jgi:hypothetical protein
MDADIYVLANNKHNSTALAFLDEYLPDRKYSNPIYEVWNEGQNFVFETEIALLEFLATTDYFAFSLAFYPNNNTSIYRNLCLYYNKDNSLICNINLYQDNQLEDTLLSKLQLFLKSPYGYIAYHVPPRRTKSEFIQIAL